MTTAARNRLLLLGAVWGLVLAVVPALVMTDPYRLTGFLIVALLCAAVSGMAGTFVAGRRVMLGRVSGRKGREVILRGSGSGPCRGSWRAAWRRFCSGR